MDFLRNKTMQLILLVGGNPNLGNDKHFAERVHSLAFEEKIKFGEKRMKQFAFGSDCF